jgi:hypothetical protein
MFSAVRAGRHTGMGCWSFLQGGGLCDVDNLRTLCVACHAQVTRQQAAERAAMRASDRWGGIGSCCLAFLVHLLSADAGAH